MGDPAAVEILFLDVDGVLTDGGVFVGSDGTEFKRFSIRDGLGIRAFKESGLEVAIISGHASQSTVRRFSHLGLEEIHVGVPRKLAVYEDVLSRRGFEPAQAGAMGDDLVDLPLLESAAFAATVPDAHDDVRRAADYVTTAAAGFGAVREVIEVILRARGLFDAARARLSG